MARQSSDRAPSRVDPVLNRVEQVVYVAIALLLMVAAAALLFAAAREFAVRLGDQELGDQALLMLVELLHTVRVSLRAHTLLPEPFLIVGLIAAIRRMLVITAEAWHLGDIDAIEFDRAMIELGLLTVLTLALVVCIILLRRSEPTAEEVAAEYGRASRASR